jgi:hypothetical protein
METQVKLPLEGGLDQFQYEMMGRNQIPGLFPSKYVEGHLLIDTSGYRSLQKYLTEHTLSKTLFKRVIEDFFALMEDSLLYYLNWHNYCIESRYVFIAHDEQTVKFIYLPQQKVDETRCPIKSFLYEEFLPYCKFNREENWTFLLEGLTILNSINYTPDNLDVLYDGFQLREIEKLRKEELAPIALPMETEDPIIKTHEKKSLYQVVVEKFKKTSSDLDQSLPVEVESQATVLLKNRVETYALLPEKNKYPKLMIKDQALIIGRNRKSSDIIINENEIGKLHAEVFIEKEVLFVRDLNSLNGTFVNGEKISPYVSHKIGADDVVRFSTITYKVTVA